MRIYRESNHFHSIYIIDRNEKDEYDNVTRKDNK